MWRNLQLIWLLGIRFVTCKVPRLTLTRRVTRTVGARRFPSSHDISRTTKERLWETTGDERAFNQNSMWFVRRARKFSAQTQSFLFGQQRSSLPHSPSPFGEECCLTLRDQTNTAAGETSKWVTKSGAKTRAKACEIAPLIFALNKQKPSATQAFWAVPHFPQNNL